MENIKGVINFSTYPLFPNYFWVEIEGGKTMILSELDIANILHSFDGDILAYKAFFDDMYANYMQ